MINLSLLKELYKINSYSGQEDQMTKFLLNHLKSLHLKLKIHTDSYNNIYVTKGKSKYYPTIVAHQDQAQTKSPHALKIIQKDNIISAYDSVTGQQWGLGADDKNGIWIALMLLKTEPVLKCVFFTGEEIGCIGSQHCDMNFFKKSKYVLQCDRRGNSDLIYNTYSIELCSNDFITKDILEKYHYKPTVGLMTDVETLKERGLSIACCNMSCGYYNPHTNSETTNVTDLINCLNFVKEIILKTPLTKHTYDPNSSYSKLYSYYGGYNTLFTPYNRPCTTTTSTYNYYVPDYYSWELYDEYDI